MSDRRPSVLFVCVHNTGRSQMAAGLLRHLAGDRIEVRSAGTQPADRIDPTAVAAMAEIGIDIASTNPTVLSEETVRGSDVAITMRCGTDRGCGIDQGCGTDVSFHPGVSWRDWNLDDPTGQPLDVVRSIREAIADHVTALIGELLPAVDRPVLHGIHHAAIICSDYQRSKSFYTEVLGLRVIAENHRAARGSWKLDLALPDDAQVELFSFPDPPPRPSRPEAQGLRHLAFRVDDVPAWSDYLQSRGITVEAIRVDEYTGRRFTFFADPDGLPLELYEAP